VAVAAVLAALLSGGAQAVACGHRLDGHGLVAAPCAAAYTAPPVYVSSYYDRYCGPACYPRYYTTRINVLRGGRWDYEAAYYVSYGGYHQRGRGVHRHGYMRGPIILEPRRW
jgi:hypothetical protein